MTSDLLEVPRKRTCSAKTKAGQSCRAYATESGLCVFHSPRQREYAVSGGKHSSLRHRAYRRIPAPLSGLLTMLEQSAQEVHDGRISPAAGSSIASIVSAIVKALETADLTKRIESIEKALE
jgi:hypothetical protein